MADVEIRPACAEDSSEIVRLIRDGTDPSFIDKLIYGCAGAPAYVQSHIEAGPRTNRRYFVAAFDGRIAACADFTVSLDALTLKYVSTASHARRPEQLVPSSFPLLPGNALLEFAIANLRDRQAWVELDVSVDNTAALRWYRVLGFTPVSQFTYWEFENDERLDRPTMDIPDWPQAQVCHAAFGFSEFHLGTPSMRVKVGRVGGAWFRLPTAEAVSAPEVRGALRAIDPVRKIYAVLPSEPAAPWVETHGKRVRTAQHMRIALSTLHRRFERSQASSPER